jgi:hypothetical protein
MPNTALVQTQKTASHISLLEHSKGINNMSPAQPFVVIHDDEPMYRNMYFIACAYANSGTLIESHGERVNEIEYLFPAVVCQAFAIELFLKFFYYLDHPEIRSKQDFTKQTKLDTHFNSELWDMLQSSYRQKIAQQAKVNEQQFRQQLMDIGDNPFVKWRYVHEQHGIDLLPLGTIKQVVSALGYTANEVMKQL